MKRAINDVDTKKKVDVFVRAARKRLKLAVGRDLLLKSLKGTYNCSGKDGNTCGDGIGIGEQTKRRRVDCINGMNAFGDAVKASDFARFALK